MQITFVKFRHYIRKINSLKTDIRCNEIVLYRIISLLGIIQEQLLGGKIWENEYFL